MARVSSFKYIDTWANDEPEEDRCTQQKPNKKPRPMTGAFTLVG